MLLLALTLTDPALAGGIYAVPPEGIPSVTLLICPSDPDCVGEAEWVSDARPNDTLVYVDSLLSLNVMKGGDASSRAETFAASLDLARTAFQNEQWSMTTKHLEDAQRALSGWNGAPENQQLFDLYYLRAAAKLATSKQAGEAFQQAASIAWNRTVTLPTEAEPYASLYYRAVHDLLTEGLGQIVLTAVPETQYILDGVQLGEGPLQISVFAGVHRLNATRIGSSDTWRTSLRVQAFRTSTATARPASPDDVGWLAIGMLQAVEEKTLEPDIAALLKDWCEHYDLSKVYILVAEPAADPFADAEDPFAPKAYGLRGVSYDPALRRFGG